MRAARAAAGADRLPPRRRHRAGQAPAAGRRTGRRQLGRGHDADRAEPAVEHGRIPRAQLQGWRLKLGADVPVFVFGGNAFAEGVGERLQELVLAPAWYLVLVPEVGCFHRGIFSAAELTRDSNPIKIAAFSGMRPVMYQWPQRSRTGGVPALPGGGRHLEWLRRYGDARMTGSGACVFCAFGSEAQARKGALGTAGGYAGFRGARPGPASAVDGGRIEELFGESPSGKAPDFDSGIRRFDPYLPSHDECWLLRGQRPERAAAS